ncbi:MAG: hypothetical protein K2W96_21135 [Gemmataceae bacterium]|nr:hypothetical protein [Gemmataceae bacterium]
MTTKEFMALPDNGMRRWLVAGVLKEWPTPGAALVPPRSLRGRGSANVLVRACAVLAEWADAQPVPRGKVLAGDAGFVLGRDPLTLVCLIWRSSPPTYSRGPARRT